MCQVRMNNQPTRAIIPLKYIILKGREILSSESVNQLKKERQSHPVHLHH